MKVFSNDVIERLNKPLDRSIVQTRKQGTSGITLSYLEGYQVIRLANEIFGFEGWTTTVERLEAVQNGAGKTIYYAVVAVAVGAVTKMDVGCGVPAGDSGDAHDTAIKAAVTDGMKRAFRQFGDQFGNGLYDKEANSAATEKPKRVVQRTEETEPIGCEEPGCPNRLTGYASNKPGGVHYNSQQQAEQSRKRFGKALCVEHMRKMMTNG